MPLYDLFCPTCHRTVERQCKINDRLAQRCYHDGDLLTVKIAPVYGKMAGTVLKGGGPDRFTADVLGCRVDELPSGLRAEQPPK